ncbi:hypothetical protein Ae201684P_016079 [Aphanomyces euteiches]|nr:hypothetical protein Ae201684P_016079 [Aphanomyces euteiches]
MHASVVSKLEDTGVGGRSHIVNNLPGHFVWSRYKEGLLLGAMRLIATPSTDTLGTSVRSSACTTDLEAAYSRDMACDYEGLPLDQVRFAR